MSARDDAGLTCTVNPTAGREHELALTPAPARKTVFVIGGGVAGMEAALVAALRGHSVTLYERSSHLGGQLCAAAIPPHKHQLDGLRAYYVRQLERTGPVVRVAEYPTAATIAEAKPDAVIVATGCQAVRPDIPGIESPKVVFAEDALLGKVSVGQRVVVIGGEMVGCETAEYLAAQGKEVTVVRRGHRLAARLPLLLRMELFARLAELNVTTLTGVRYELIDDRGLLITAADGSQQMLEADTLVVATGSTPCQDLVGALRDQAIPVTVAGDAVEPRGLREAIREGMIAGWSV